MVRNHGVVDNFTDRWNQFGFNFKFTDVQHSKMISGGNELTLLPNIQGRGMFKLGTKLIQTQTPYISLNQFNTVLDKHWVDRPEEIEEEMELLESSAEPVIVEEKPVTNIGIEGLFVSEESFLKQIPAN